MSPDPGTPLWRSCALALLSILAACTAVDRSHEPLGELPPGDGRLFTRLPAAVTGITFDVDWVDGDEPGLVAVHFETAHGRVRID